ncbi:5,6-dimethylbenzimidazole synthase [Shewanella schlegeliana]|uniref:5,6-dimethylbenzimidazole synthase n=1 Tax=Shewanella schlegeliana TaxID=190308 RepID=A0ABS1SVF1_9GAMM|nr:5,6-dimethylbenzimidazole synthase [Shewanella schlegeliana]MBL4912517.1 5,6-dimethylbenzimidazole synthase [Shewanella schlegeliana]MCL1108013.1 5,6-dimethylbenzimidazole synthase [Shewanella schlegeliana]GIU21421.1 5,6-dimethylbenzimidazole synthase [Shewanella schlegeliana]
MSHQFSENDSLLLAEIIRLRRDVRGTRFLSSPIDDNTLDKLLEAAINAPSVGYSQPWQFVVIREDGVKQQVHHSFIKENAVGAEQFSGEKQRLYQNLKLEGILEAPVNLAVFYQPQAKPVLGQTSMADMGRFSVVCAIQNLWLMARSLNIGVGWVSIIDPESVKKILNAPQDAELIGYLCIGYVEDFLAEPELKALGWEKQKTMSEVIIKERFDSTNQEK